MMINKKREPSVSYPKIVFLIFPAAVLSLILVLAGCGVVKGDFFGLEFGDTQEETQEESFEELQEASEDIPQDIEEDQPESVETQDAVQDIQEESSADMDLEEIE